MKKIILACLLFILISGCATRLPKRWAGPNEAFPSSRIQNCSELPGGACRQTIMNFTYDEVYASTIKALSFAQINIVEEDEDAGFVYGLRSKAIESKLGRGNIERHYFRIGIEELDAEKCRVTAHAKTQTAGKYMPWLTNVWLPTAGMAVFFLATVDVELVPISLVYTVVAAPLAYIVNTEAKKVSQVRWSKDDDEDLDRILSFIRTDLLQE